MCPVETANFVVLIVIQLCNISTNYISTMYFFFNNLRFFFILGSPCPETTKESSLDNLMEKLRAKSAQYKSWNEMTKSLRVAIAVSFCEQ